MEKDRKEIDQLDKKILEILNKRAKLSVSIARIKLRDNIPIFMPEREAELLDKIVLQNKGPFENDAIRNIFTSIMDESKRLQHDTVKISADTKKNEKR